MHAIKCTRDRWTQRARPALSHVSDGLHDIVMLSWLSLCLVGIGSSCREGDWGREKEGGSEWEGGREGVRQSEKEGKKSQLVPGMWCWLQWWSMYHDVLCIALYVVRCTLVTQRDRPAGSSTFRWKSVTSPNFSPFCRAVSREACFTTLETIDGGDRNCAVLSSCKPRWRMASTGLVKVIVKNTLF